jgi:acetyltransferase-like isoleucine patch superfamily enzyme
MIHPGVKIRNPHKLTVGNAVHIGEDDFIQAGGGVHIGDNVMLGPGVKIWSQNHDYEGGEAVDDQRYLYAKVIIEDGVWVGANAFIMPGVHLPKGTVVSAGSIVGMKAYPAYSVISGNPARVVARRQGELNASSSTAHKDGNSDQNGRNSPDDQSGHAPSLSKGGEVVTAIGSVQRS